MSREWIEELDAAAVAVDPEVEFELEQVVTASPYGDVHYRLVLRDGRLRVRPSGDVSSPADAVLTVDYATAVDLATGRKSGSDAFEEGLVRFRGDLGRLQDARAALAAAAEALAATVSGTTFPPASGTTYPPPTATR